MKLFENFKLPDVETLKNTVEAIKDNLTPAEKAKESSKDNQKKLQRKKFLQVVLNAHLVAIS